MKKRLLFTFIFLLVYASSWAQNIIKGTVLDKNNQQPIIGATVVAGKKGTVTDPNGKFSLDAPAGTLVLHVTFIGYQPQDIPVGKGNVQVLLSPDERSLEQVVVVGYGTQKKANLTGAVNTVDIGKTMQSRPITDPSKALQGISPGLNIQFSNGGLASGTPSINIRGVGSLNGTSRPLILVDNVETPDLTLINPEDIESVSVLKDAASTSIYGARAAFGVVLIKTKSGTRNTPTRITYSNNFAWNSPLNQPDFADPEKELPGLINSAARAGLAPEAFGMSYAKTLAGIKNWKAKYANNRTSNEMIPGEDFDLPTANDPALFYRVWDIKDIMFKKWTPQQIHNLNVQGGSERVSYYLSAGYNQNSGVMKPNPDGLKKYNITGAISAQATKWLDVDLKMMYRNYEYDFPFEYWPYFQYMWRWGAYFPYGTYKGVGFRTPAGLMGGAPTNSVVDNYTRVNLGATLKLTKDLNIRADYTIGRDNIVRHETANKINLWNYWSATMPLENVATTSQDFASYGGRRFKVNTFNIYATYDKKLGKDHQLKLMAGMNAEDTDTLGFGASKRNILDPSMPELTLAIGDQSVNGFHYINAYAGFFGRVNYAYKDKWLLELNGRYDGASAYPVNNRWAFFPSASAGYRITEENFMQSYRKVLSDMKIRASYGTLGNLDVGGKYYIPSMETGNVTGWMNGNILALGVDAPSIVSDALRWEKVNTLDFGTDISLFNNNINVTFDWYQRNTNGMITSRTVPAFLGASAPKINDGSLRTTGYEISIGGNYQLKKDWTVYGTLAFWDNKTVVTEWNNPSMLINQAYKGKVVGEIWGFETDRYFTSADDVTSSPDQSKLTSGNFKFGPGDIKYKDLNDDKVINGGKGTLNDHGDLKRIGNSRPRYQYSLRLGSNFKQFDIDVLFQGVGKQDFWGLGDIAIPLYRGNDIMYDHQLDFWTPDNPNAKYPNPFPGNNGGNVTGLARLDGSNNFYPQSKYLLNLSYLRLKNITLGYTLPDELAKRIHLQRLRIYGSAQNIATFSNVGVPIDPEITTGQGSIYGRTWPFQKTWSFGLQVNF